MNKKLARLTERRHQLVAQAAAQRIVLTRNLAPWRSRLALVDQGIAAVRYVRSHPVLMGGATLLFVALRPGRVTKWLRRGWLAWQIGRRMRGR